jgi:multiple sugar transport system permease protein
MKPSKGKIYLLVAPALVVLAFVGAGPLLYALYLSTHEWSFSGPGAFVGLANFTEILGRPNFWQAASLTGLYVLGTLGIQIPLGLGIALLLVNDIPYKRTVKMLFILPMICSPVIVGVVWRMLYDAEFGMVNYVLSDVLGFVLPQPWLGQTSTALMAIIVANIWYMTPFVVLMLSAGLDALPVEPYESAAIDGASRWQVFWNVTLPALKPVLVVVVLIRFIDSFKSFDILYVMTRGGPGRSTTTLSILSYLEGFKFGNMNNAAVIALFILLVLASVSLLMLLASRRMPAQT